ncbi:MAG: acyloxyacyl hydrolase, partial [Wohlfahrtiimonas sp.]
MKLLYLRKLVACTLLSVLASSTANAWEIEVSAGSTDESQTVLRFGFNQEWDARFLDSSLGYFSSYWSLGLTHWEKGIYGKDVASISFSPVLTYNFYTKNGLEPFIELGIGIAGFSRAKVGDQNLGSAFNFEDRIGFGARFGDHTFGARAIHYSNAGLK